MEKNGGLGSHNAFFENCFLERVIPGPTTMLIGWGVRSVVKTGFLSLQRALIALLMY